MKKFFDDDDLTADEVTRIYMDFNRKTCENDDRDFTAKYAEERGVYGNIQHYDTTVI